MFSHLDTIDNNAIVVSVFVFFVLAVLLVHLISSLHLITLHPIKFMIGFFSR